MLVFRVRRLFKFSHYFIHCRKNGHSGKSIIIPQLSFQLTYIGHDASYLEQVAEFIGEWESGAEDFRVHTSGSTGMPKTIVLKREQLIASAERTIAHFGLKPGDKMLMSLSPKVIGGRMMIVRALVGNLHLLVTQPSSNPLSDVPEEMSVDFISLVPAQLKIMIDRNEPGLKKVKTILLGGAPVSEELENHFAALPSKVVTGFGMTETVSHIALREAGKSVYEALPGVSFSVHNGRLVIDDELLHIQKLETTDSVRLIDNKHFEWKGRTDFVINSGGIKIHPEQLETVLSPLIRGEFIIAGIPDEQFGEVCILIAEKKLTGKIDLEEIQEYTRSRSGRYSAPKTIVYADIKKTAAGKTDRKATIQSVIDL